MGLVVAVVVALVVAMSLDCWLQLWVQLCHGCIYELGLVVMVVVVSDLVI